MEAAAVSLVAAGGRKYLTSAERDRFIATARRAPRPEIQTFALTLVHTGCRISEALAVRAGDVDLEARALELVHWIDFCKRRAQKLR